FLTIRFCCKRVRRRRRGCRTATVVAWRQDLHLRHGACQPPQPAASLPSRDRRGLFQPREPSPQPCLIGQNAVAPRCIHARPFYFLPPSFGESLVGFLSSAMELSSSLLDGSRLNLPT